MERNNIFKYATKELSQDAFLCWCINWINSDENFSLGKAMLELLVGKFLPNLNYEKGKIKVEIRKQYMKIDILLIINKEFFVIIEDKIDSLEHSVGKTTIKQLEKYKKDFIDRFNMNKKSISKTLEEKSNLDLCKNTKINENNVYTIYLKTGKLQENVSANNIIKSEDILKIIENYLHQNKNTKIKYILEDFQDYLIEKMDLYNENKSDKFVGKAMKIGEKFGKRYFCFNCFKDQINFRKKGVDKYNKNYQYSRRSTKVLNKNVSIWTPRKYSNGIWSNTIKDNSNTIVEKFEGKDANGIREEKRKYRYVFIRKRDIYHIEYFEFLGLFYLDNSSTNIERVWKRYRPEEESVLLNAQVLEK